MRLSPIAKADLSMRLATIACKGAAVSKAFNPDQGRDESGRFASGGGSGGGDKPSLGDRVRRFFGGGDKPSAPASPEQQRADSYSRAAAHASTETLKPSATPAMAAVAHERAADAHAFAERQQRDAGNAKQADYHAAQGREHARSGAAAASEAADTDARLWARSKLSAHHEATAAGHERAARLHERAGAADRAAHHAAQAQSARQRAASLR